jgi:hypothetical protein
MKRAFRVLLFLFFSSGLAVQCFGQTLSCRPLEKGDTFLEPNEQVVNGQACKILATTATTQTPAPASVTKPLAPGTARVVGVSVMQSHYGSDGDLNERIRQVYRLERADSVFDVTGWESTFGKARKRPAMEIGDVVSYRIDPKHGQFIDILLADTDKKQKVEWHRFLRVGAEAKQ